MKSLQRIITERLFESNKQRMDEASFEVGGKKYVCAFGRYSCDGEQISREEYFKARGKNNLANHKNPNGERYSDEKARARGKRQAIAQFDRDQAKKADVDKKPESSTDTGFGYTLGDIEKKLIDVKTTLKDARRRNNLYSNPSIQKEVKDLEAQERAFSIAHKYSKKGMSPEQAIEHIQKVVAKKQSELPKYEAERDALMKSGDYEFSDLTELNSKITNIKLTLEQGPKHIEILQGFMNKSPEPTPQKSEEAPKKSPAPKFDTKKKDYYDLQGRVKSEPLFQDLKDNGFKLVRAQEKDANRDRHGFDYVFSNGSEYVRYSRQGGKSNRFAKVTTSRTMPPEMNFDFESYDSVHNPLEGDTARVGLGNTYLKKMGFLDDTPKS